MSRPAQAEKFEWLLSPFAAGVARMTALTPVLAAALLGPERLGTALDAFTLAACVAIDSDLQGSGNLVACHRDIVL